MEKVLIEWTTERGHKVSVEGELLMREGVNNYKEDMDKRLLSARESYFDVSAKDIEIVIGTTKLKGYKDKEKEQEQVIIFSPGSNLKADRVYIDDELI